MWLRKNSCFVFEYCFCGLSWLSKTRRLSFDFFCFHCQSLCSYRTRRRIDDDGYAYCSIIHLKRQTSNCSKILFRSAECVGEAFDGALPVLDVHNRHTGNFTDPPLQIFVTCCDDIAFVLQENVYDKIKSGTRTKEQILYSDFSMGKKTWNWKYDSALPVSLFEPGNHRRTFLCACMEDVRIENLWPLYRRENKIKWWTTVLARSLNLSIA